MQSTRFFKPVIEAQPTPIVKDYILNLLTTAVVEYDTECKKSAPSETAIKRKNEFLNKINALKAATTLLEQNNAFTNICEFYLKYRNSGRLLNQVSEALFHIFNLEKQCSLLDQEYKIKLQKIKTPRNPDYIKNPTKRGLRFSLIQDAWAMSKIDLLETALKNQQKYSNFIVSIYKLLPSCIGESLTGIIASYIPKEEPDDIRKLSS